MAGPNEYMEHGPNAWLGLEYCTVLPLQWRLAFRAVGNTVSVRVGKI